MRVVLAADAVSDLSGFGRFIAHDNPQRAAAFISELREVAYRLAEMPLAFPLVPRYERRGIRRRSWKGYAIFFSVLADQVYIHRILGLGQDIDRVLGLS